MKVDQRALWMVAISLVIASWPALGQQGRATFLPPANNAKYAPDRILVKFRPAVSVSARTAVHSMIGTGVLRRFAAIGDLEVASLPSGMSVRQAIRAYQQRPEVEYAEPDYIVHALSTPDDPLFPQMWNLLNTGQNGGTPGADIGAISAWNLSTGSQNIVVAVIDTGVDYTHPDLATNIWSAPSPFSTTANGVNVSCAAGTHGFNAITDVCDPMDDNGHGTHVSGTIGATGNNALGVVGVNWSVQVMACKFLNASGSGQISDAITCLDIVAVLKGQGFNIIATNNSWGGGPYSQALNDAIQAQQQAGILFITAAGNDFGDNDGNPTYPANTALPNVISVAATTDTDALAVFSNIGQHTVHLGAPGQQILSTLPGNTYGIDSGTSMATPHVTGAAALLAAQNPSLDWRAIKNLILAGGDSRASLAQTISGNRLNVYGAMTCAGKTLAKRLQPVNNAIAAAPGVPVTLEELNIDCAQPNGNVQVTVSPGGQVLTLVDDGTGADQAAADGVYTGQWAPAAIGSYSLTFPGGDVVPVAVLSDYVYTPAPFSYRTITGTNLNLGDDNVAQVTSPFPIPFGGGGFTQLQVGSNGTISFTDAYSPFINGGIPTSLAPPITLVAPFWMDLYPVKGSAQNVYWAVTGSTPNRELVVEWRNVRSFPCRNDPTATVTFEVVFSESSSDVLFEYSDTTFGGLCAWEDHGYFTTAGVQVAPTVGSQWSAFQANVGDGTALLWTVSTTAPGPNPVPHITSFSPPTATEGGPAFTLTVNGSNFVPGATVQFGLFTRVTTYVSSTQLTAQILASDIAPTAGPSAYITVTNPPLGGGSSGTLTFPFTTDLPTITSITPPSVTAGSFSFSLVINGTGFAQTASSVYWNGTLLQGDLVFGSTQIIVGVPFTNIVNPGTAQITVVNGSPGGGSSNPATLTILPSGGFASLYLQAPLLNGIANPQNLLSAQPPVRFLGWKYASRGGPNYLRAFQRGRANMSSPSLNPALVGALGNGVGAQNSTSNLPATLPGLGLRPLLPADFIPTSVAVGDFNGDGIPDWVVANGGSNNLWVYLGRGDGTFMQATVIPLAGQSPIAVAVADLRGIGKRDLIVAEADSLTIGVLLGHGDGTFGQEQDYIVPGAPISLAVADFDGDGHLDVAAGLVPSLDVPVSGPLVLLPGIGAGGFGTPKYEPSQFSDPGLPESIVAADFEKNGKPDIVLVDPSFGALAYGNDGSGRFKFEQAVYGNPFIPPLTAAQGDVNEDGCPDVVIVDSLDIARVFFGNCDGTFQNQFTEVGLGDIGWGLALADVNGDGHLDLIYSGIGGGGTGGLGQGAGNLIGVLQGDGAGNFGNAQVYRGGQSSYGLAVGDFNKDGHPDIIAANQNSDSVTLLLNGGTGDFGTPEGEYLGYVHGNNSSGAVNSPITNFTPVDVDGDGQKDLVVMQLGPGTPNPYQITVMLNQGGGKFGPPILSPGMEGAVTISDYVLADFRNTGHPDFLALSNPAGLGYAFLVFAPNAGGGQFGIPQITRVTGFGIMAVGDFDGDGNLDFAAAAAVGNSPTNAVTITIYLGHGDGTLTPSAPITFNTSSPGHWPAGLWVEDFNHDGKLDLLVWMYENVVPYSTNDVYELLGNGNGTFAQPKQVLSNLSGFAVADVNHDGLPDIIESRDPQANYPAQLPPQYRVFLCQADGSFSLTNTYSPYLGWAASASSSYGTPNGSRYTPWVGDFNGDGNIDIAAFQQRPGFYPANYYVQFMLGNGDGTFTPTYDVFDLHRSVPSAAADFNGDGITDMAELDGFTSSFHVIAGQAAPTLQAQMVSDPVVGTNGAVRISLNVPASGGTSVNLAASDPAISIPASVAIPQGALTQDVNFTIGSSFNSSHVFSIQAKLGGSTAVAYGTQAQPGGQYGVAMFVNNSSESTVPGGTTPDYQLGFTSIAGYSTALSLSCQGLPVGATCQFGATQIDVPAGQNVATSLTVSTSGSTPLGVHPFTISGTDGNVTSTTMATLDVGDYSVSISPSNTNALPNSNASYSVNISVVNNYSANLTATCSGLPAPAVCNLSGVVFAGSNQVTIQTNSLAVGSYPFTVSVTNGTTTRTATAQLTVWDFKTSLSSSAVTVAVGKSANVGITVTGQNGFSDAVSLACIGAPVGVSCSISPGTATPSPAGTPATLTLTVNSKPPGYVSQHQSNRTISSGLQVTLAGIFFAMAVIVVPFSRQRRAAVTTALLVAIGLAVACGGSGGGGGGGGGGGSVSFVLTVQATADNVVKNSTITVTVP